MALPLLSIGGFLEGIGEAIVNGFLLILQTLARSLISLELLMLEDLALKTPAIGPRWFDTPLVVDIPGITGPGGIINDFYTKTFSLVLLGSGIAILLSGLMLLLGFMPRWRAAALENLVRAPVFLFLAMAAPWLLQFFIDANSVLVTVGFAGEEEYQEMQGKLWDGLFGVDSVGDEWGQLIGLLVAGVALLLVLLELATRYGVVIFIGAISPLVIMGLAFNFTRGFSTKALQLFIGAVFFQGFAAIALRLMLEIVVAYEGGGGIASWALLAGIATMIASLPKVLANASEAVSGGVRAMQLGTAAAIGLTTAGVGLAARGAGMATQWQAQRSLARTSPTTSARRMRTLGHLASFSRSVEGKGQTLGSFGRQTMVHSAYLAMGLGRPPRVSSHRDGDDRHVGAAPSNASRQGKGDAPSNGRPPTSPPPTGPSGPTASAEPPRSSKKAPGPAIDAEWRAVPDAPAKPPPKASPPSPAAKPPAPVAPPSARAPAAKPTATGPNPPAPTVHGAPGRAAPSPLPGASHGRGPGRRPPLPSVTPKGIPIRGRPPAPPEAPKDSPHGRPPQPGPPATPAAPGTGQPSAPASSNGGTPDAPVEESPDSPERDTDAPGSSKP